jgi:hypothetical protein
MRRAVSKPGDPENGCRPGVRPCPTAKAKRKKIKSNRNSGETKKTNAKRDPDNRDGLGEKAAQIPIRATLIASNCCEALGITGRGYTPVLALCRALVGAGHDPRRPLHAYRGHVLALVVRSIGDGARLRVATHGVGFEGIPECTGGAPVRQNGPSVAGQRTDDARVCATACQRSVSGRGTGRHR